MGQRLNLEITMGNNVLANAYYHWSGYTSCALKLTRIALEKFREIKFIPVNVYDMTIDMLENTGAKFTDEELKAFNSVGFYDIIGREMKKKQRNSDNVNRNDGLISITSMGINNTRKFEEARVQIDIKKQKINFNAVLEVTEKELKEDYEIKKPDGEKIDFDFENISFSEFQKFSKTIMDMIQCGKKYALSNNKYYVFVE